MGFRTSRADRLAAACLGLWMSACTLVPDGAPPPSLYNLTPLDMAPATPPVTASTFVVELPTAAGGLDTNRIAVRESALHLQYYAGARWVERAPEMVQTLVVTSMRDAGGVAAVARRSLSLHPDFRLRTEIEAFEAVYPGGDGPPDARVRIHAVLLEQPSQRVVATGDFAATRTAASPAVPEVIRAFDAAVHEVLDDLVAWTVRSAAGAAGG